MRWIDPAQARVVVRRPSLHAAGARTTRIHRKVSSRKMLWDCENLSSCPVRIVFENRSTGPHVRCSPTFKSSPRQCRIMVCGEDTFGGFVSCAQPHVDCVVADHHPSLRGIRSSATWKASSRVQASTLHVALTRRIPARGRTRWCSRHRGSRQPCRHRAHRSAVEIRSRARAASPLMD